jgi:hypothetical protein
LRKQPCIDPVDAGFPTRSRIYPHKNQNEDNHHHREMGKPSSGRSKKQGRSFMADVGGRRRELPGKSQKPAECRKKLQFFVLFILKVYI